MANIFEAAAVTSGAPALNTPFFEIRNGSGGPVEIMEIGVSLGAATATNVGLVRATAQGTGGTGLLGGQAGGPRLTASTCQVAASAFTSAPTFTAANMFRRFHLPAAIGAGLIWAWNPGEMIIPASASLLLFTPTIAGAASISSYAKWTE